LATHLFVRQPDPSGFANDQALHVLGLGREQIASAMVGTYRLLDRIDETLVADGVDPLCLIVELANLSSMIGNVIGAELAKHSNGLYRRNSPHKFPDLLPAAQGAVSSGIEIKMALNRNQPKGHLAKEGYYITCRYVLVDKDGKPITEAVDRPKARRAVIWELRTGHLDMGHFNLSNTEGDSGKTAVVNAAGMEQLKVVYVDLALVPGTQRGTRYRAYRAILGR
jgi:hypothetical protein